MGQKLTRVTFSARDFNMAERETLQVVIQRFKLKKSIAAILILLEILEEDGKRESRRGKTREEKGYFNNIVQELITKILQDTTKWWEWRLFLEILRLMEPDITPRPLWECQLSYSCLSFAFVYDSAFLRQLSPHFKQRPPKLLLRSPVFWTNGVRKQHAVSMDTSRWESVVHMRAVQTNKKSPIKHENKGNVLSCLIECLMAFKCYQTRPNTIKQHQTKWPNGKMFGHQTMFDGVWSPNISRLDRPLEVP